MIYTTINKIYLSEAGNQIFFDIASAAPTNFVLHSIVLEKFEDLEFSAGIPIPSETPFATITNSDIVDFDATQLTFNTSHVINPVGKSLLFVFIYYAATSDPTTVSPSNYDIFCIHNGYDYAKAFMNLTKKINQNNSTPKEMVDIILLNKAIHYAILSSNYQKANIYFQKLIKYYD